MSEAIVHVQPQLGSWDRATWKRAEVPSGAKPTQGHKQGLVTAAFKLQDGADN